MVVDASSGKLVSCLPDALFVAHGRRLVYLNPALLRMVGDRPEKPTGLSLFRLFPGKGGWKVAQAIERVLEEGGSVKVEAELATQSASLPVEVLLFPLDGVSEREGPPLVAGRLRDLSQEKLILEQLNNLKQENHDLRVEMDRILALINRSGDGFAIVNQQGIVEYQNEQMTAWFGNRVGKPCPYLHRRGSLCSPCHQVFASGQPAKLEVKGPGGLTLEVHCSPFTDTPGAAKALLVVRDVTEYKKMAELLRESEKIYRNLTAQAPHGVFVVDEQQVVFANRTFASLVNHTLDEIYNLSLIDVFVDLERDSREALLTHLQQQRRRHKPLRGVYYVRTPEGKRRWLDLITFPITYRGRKAVQGIIVDITARKEGEAALQASEEKYRVLAESSPNGILIISQGRVVYANKAAAKLAGVTTKEIQQWTVEDLLALASPEEQARIKLRFQRRKGARPPSRYELRITDKQGNTRWIELYGRRIKLADTQATQYILVDVTERKRVLAALKESEEKYRILAEQSPLAFVILTRNGIVYANRRLADIILTPLQDIRKWGLEKIVNRLHPEDAERVKHFILSGLEGKRVPKRLEFRLINREGDILWLEAHARTITYQGERALQVVLQDISDRKRAEQALKESEEKYRTLADQSLQGIVVFQDDRIVYANQAAADIVRLSIKALKSMEAMEWIRYIHPEDVKMVIERFRARLEGKEVPPHYEHRIIRRDGKVGWVEMYASRIMFGGRPAIQVIILDITDRKMAEQALKESEARYRALVEGLEEAVLLLDSELRVIFSNPRAQQMLGYTAEELKGKTWHELVPEDLHSKVEQEIARRRRGVASRYELELLDSRGRRIPVLVAARPILTNGHMTGILTAFTDITPLKRLERQLRREKQEAEFYTDVVTHDLNNVNQALTTYLELLAVDQDVTPSQAKLLGEARALVKRSVKLCRMVRRLFQIRAAILRLHQVDLASVLRHIAKTAPQQHPHRQVTIRLKLPKGEIPVWADELIDELFFNLLDNIPPPKGWS